MIQINHVKKTIGGHVIFDDLSMQIADQEFAATFSWETSMWQREKTLCTTTGMKWASCFRILPW